MSLFSEIRHGDWDDDLDLIIQSATDRRRTVRAQAAAKLAAELQDGDRVVITGFIKPKYLVGEVGTVMMTPPPGGVKKAGYTWIDFGHSVGRFGRYVNCPTTCFRKVA